MYSYILYYSLAVSTCRYLPSLINRSNNRSISSSPNANMSSNLSSSDNTSSGRTSSTRIEPRPTLTRPLFVREDSYTHVFPASSTSMNTRSTTTQKSDTHRPAALSISPDDNTRRLMGGLQWLLEATTQPQTPSRPQGPSAPLSEKAIASFNQHSNADRKGSSDSTETAAWIDGQRKTRAAPPF